MPAVALVGAFASVSAGLAVGGILGGVMIAGGVMTGLGAITGNKKLQMLGSIVSLGAGAYGMATGAFSAASSTAGTNIGDMVAPLDGAGATADALAFDPYTSALAEPTAGAADAVTGLPTSSFNADGAMEYATAPGAAPKGLIGQPSQPATQQASSNVQRVQSDVAGGMQTKDALTDTTDTGIFGGTVDKLKSFGGWIEKNPQVAKLGLAAGNGLLQSYSQQQAAAEQQRLAADARARYNNSITNQRRV